MAFHCELTGLDIHVINTWTYANSAARDAATGFTSDDVYKVAVQSDDNSIWILTDHSPITWMQVGGVVVGDINHCDLDNLLEDCHTQYSPLDGSRAYTQPVCGAPPTIGAHLATKAYVDGEIVSDHGDLTGLLDVEDHPDYSTLDGARAYTAPVSGQDPTLDPHLTTKFYVDTAVAAASAAGDAIDVILEVRKNTAGSIPKGRAVYLAGFNLGVGVPTVEEARADSFTTMPAIGVTRETITNSANGIVVAFGTVGGLDTSAFSVKDDLFVSPDTAGLLVTPAPTGADNYVQKVAEVTRSNASVGTIFVFGAGRANAVPNITTDHVWVGDENGVAEEVLFSHGNLLNLDKDQHTLYVPTSGGRGFSVPISGAYPTFDDHLATKEYVDMEVAAVSAGVGALNTEWAVSEGISETTSDSYQQKLRLTTSDLPSGSYMIQYSWEMNGDNEHGWSRCELNDSELAEDRYDSSQIDFIMLSGFAIETMSGVNNIDIDFRANTSGDTMQIRRARIAVWRIS